MKGLLLKNFKNILPTLAYYCFFFIVCLVVSLITKEFIYAGCVCVMLSVAVPTASMTRDEQDKWDKFALSAGISRGKLVGSRYLFSICIFVPAWLLTAVVCLAVNGIGENFAQLVLFAGIGLIAVSVMLPLIHKFGVEKSRILLIIIIVAIFASVIAVVPVLFGNVSAEFSFFIPLAVIVVVGAVAFCCSFFISRYICNKKDY